MTCQVCGTVDNRHRRGPVVSKGTGEGVCYDCFRWVFEIEFKARNIENHLWISQFEDRGKH